MGKTKLLWARLKVIGLRLYLPDDYSKPVVGTTVSSLHQPCQTREALLFRLLRYGKRSIFDRPVEKYGFFFT